MVVFTFHFLLLKVKWTGVRAIFRIYPNWNNPPPPPFFSLGFSIHQRSVKKAIKRDCTSKKKIWYDYKPGRKWEELKAKRDSHRYSRSNLERPLVLSGQWFFFILILVCVCVLGGVMLQSCLCHHSCNHFYWSIYYYSCSSHSNSFLFFFTKLLPLNFFPLNQTNSMSILLGNRLCIPYKISYPSPTSNLCLIVILAYLLDMTCNLCLSSSVFL